MRGLTLLIICQLIIMSHITAVWAEEESVKVKDVVITATKTEVEIEDVPASVEVITKEEIKAKGAEKLRDIIGFATGIYKEPYFAREDSSVGIRGFKPEQTLILIDGRRLTGEVSNAYEIDRITLENVERIEIIRGPASALYGSDALGGVINIITKPPENLSFDLTPEYGIFEGGKGGQRSINTRIDSGKIGNLGFSIAGSLINRDAVFNEGRASLIGDGEHKNLSFKSVYDFTKATRLTLDAGYMKEDVKDWALVSSALYRYTDDNKRQDLSLGLSHSSPELEYQLRAYTSIYSKNQETRKDSTNAISDFTEAERQTPVIEGKISKELFTNHLFTFGGEYRHEFFKGTRLDTGEGNFTATRGGITMTGSEARLNYRAGYVQDEWQAFDNLLIIPAIRYDSSDKFENEISPKIGATYKIVPELRIKVGYGHGFKSPTPRELYYDFRHSAARYRVAGNPNIKSEKSNSYEAAIEGEKGIFSGRAAYFYNDVSDLITTVEDPAYAPAAGWRGFMYKNIKKAEIQGVELEGGAGFNNGLFLQASYSYLDAKDKDTNQRLVNRVKNKIVAKGIYDIKPLGLKVNLWWEYIGGLLWSTTPLVEKDYDIYYLSLSKNIGKAAELYAGVDNLFNRKDADIPIVGSFYYSGIRVNF